MVSIARFFIFCMSLFAEHAIADTEAHAATDAATDAGVTSRKLAFLPTVPLRGPSKPAVAKIDNAIPPIRTDSARASVSVLQAKVTKLEDESNDLKVMLDDLQSQMDKRLPFDPLQLHSPPQPLSPLADGGPSGAGLAAAVLAGSVAFGGSQAAWAATAADASVVKNAFAQTDLDPATFQPVCPASDGLYRFSQQLVLSVVGADGFKEYAPLIAGGLLRLRLEVCVLESFIQEGVIPFVREKGISWILPVHETVETFLAGVIFAIAANFILIGSTKLFTVVAVYADVLLGFPLRVVGDAGWRLLEDKAMPSAEPPPPPDNTMDRISQAFAKPPPRVEPSIFEVWKVSFSSPADFAAFVCFGTLRTVGGVSGSLRRGIEGLDFFIGRYLILTTVGYVALKFVHYKIFDPFP